MNLPRAGCLARWPRLARCAVLAAGLAGTASAAERVGDGREVSPPAGPYAVAVNPIKPLLGLVGAQGERHLGGWWAISATAEVRIFDNLGDRRDDHPDLVVFAGPAIYPVPGLHGREHTGPFAAAHAGGTWSWRREQEGALLGGALGYKLPLSERIFLSGRALVNRDLLSGSTPVGAEALLGLQLGRPR